jgi:hypothetical protein
MGRMPAFPEFTVEDLEQLAGRKSFERGLDYLDMLGDLEVADRVRRNGAWQL